MSALKFTLILYSEDIKMALTMILNFKYHIVVLLLMC